MKSLIIFCRKTGRNLADFIDKLIRSLTASGQWRISVAISIPFIAKIEVAYIASTDRKKTA